MTFHSVGGALRWYAKAVQSDGIRSIWPSRSTALCLGTGGAGRDQVEVFLMIWAIWRCLQRLTLHEQALLHEVYILEIPIQYVAGRSGRHPSRIYDRLRRIRETLADTLRTEGLLDSETCAHEDGDPRRCEGGKETP
jgi:hypothetical protein